MQNKLIEQFYDMTEKEMDSLVSNIEAKLDSVK